MADLKVKAGDPVSAKAWNQIVDLLPVNSAGFGAAINGTVRITITVNNDSGANRDIGEAMALTTWDGVAAATDVYSVMESASWLADVITWHSDIERFCVLAEPIPSGERGTAVIYGPCIVKLKASQTDKSHVFFDPSDTKQFITGDSGVGRLLHRFASQNYAIVNLGDMQPLFRYQLSENSLAPSTTTATLEFLDGTTIASGTIEVSDPLSFMGDQVSGDEGFCTLVGNKFFAIQATC